MLSFFSISFACECVINVPESEQIKGIKEADAIFYGEVISVANDNQIETTKPITFKILRTWKGTAAENITIEANANSSCRLTTEIGEKLLIFTGSAETKNSDNYLNYCSPDQFDKKILEKVYGNGKIVETKEQMPETSVSFWSIVWQKIISIFS